MFRDSDRAAVLLDDLQGIPSELLDRLGRAADPDLALENLAALAEAVGEDRLWELLDDPSTRERLVLVLGTSQALGEFLVAHPGAVADLISTASVGALVGEAGDVNALRVAYRRELLAIAARD